MAVEKITSLICKPSDQRRGIEIELAIPLLKRHCEVFRDLDRGCLYDIIKHCEYQRSVRDDVIVQQGDKGFFMYIILTGRASVFVDNFVVDDLPNPEETVAARVGLESQQGGSLDRSKFGKFIINFEPGKRFGEMALMAEDEVRNATVIADQMTDLLVIGKDLFNRTLRVNEEREYHIRKDFINNSPLFGRWPPQLKRLVEMSLRKETYRFNTVVTKQGDLVRGLFFISSGQVKLDVNTSQHYRQYPRIFGDMSDQKVKSKPVSRDGITLGLIQDHIRLRRTQGYSASEQRYMSRTAHVCSLQDNECFGDIEVILGLETYLYTVVSMAHTQIYVLDTKNFERLVLRKKNKSGDRLRSTVFTKIIRRIETQNIPIMLHLAAKMKTFIPKARNRSQTKMLSLTGSNDSSQTSLALSDSDPSCGLVIHSDGGLSRTRKTSLSSRGISRPHTAPHRHPRSIRLLAGSDLHSYVKPKSAHRGKSARGRNIPEMVRRWRDAALKPPSDRPHTAPSGPRQKMSPQPHSANSFGQHVAFKTISQPKNAKVNVGATIDSYRSVLHALQIIKVNISARSSTAVSTEGADVKHADYSLPDNHDDVTDDETSQAALEQLENKMASFFQKLDAKEKTRSVNSSYKLKRFRLENGGRPPTPGGRVLIRTTPCPEPTGTDKRGASGHHHVRRFVLSRPSDFTRLYDNPR
ncbi:uncharacterized protein LOC135466215 [Liolophura sinensis]|uniref:uncharacterized protein LOC135466215 n=1 Tax=Liolophura sinensis TaxID=3198878 RepID=UPI0031580ABC